MKREYYTHQSKCLNREMHILIHGEKGLPLLVFPTQDSTCTNFEDFGMINTISDFIDRGDIMVFTVDTVDKESWSDLYGDKARLHRTEEHLRQTSNSSGLQSGCHARRYCRSAAPRSLRRMYRHVRHL